MRSMGRNSAVRLGAALALGLSLGGCKEVLYSNLAERDANEMVAILAASGIETSRTHDKDGIYALNVEARDVPAAITILRQAGYPHDTFQTLGEVFNAEGIFGTPFEQQNRFIHAMNQELSRTISEVQGIRSARVLVTSPPRGRFDREPPRATASVTIHHEPDFDVHSHISSIKMIVAGSLPNLDYQDVVVALFPSEWPTLQPIAAGAEPLAAAGPAGPVAMAVAAVPDARRLPEWLRVDRTPRVVVAMALLAAVLLLARRRGRPGR